MTLYKLTDQNMRDHDTQRWALGEWQEAPRLNGTLRAYAYIYAYESPLLAVLHNPIHADFSNPRLFKCEYQGEIVRDGQMRCSIKKFRLVKEIPTPKITIAQRVRYAIYCVREVLPSSIIPEWWAWSENWLNGTNRTIKSAKATMKATRGAPRAAARAAGSWEAASAAWEAASEADWEGLTSVGDWADKAARWAEAEAMEWSAGTAKLATDLFTIDLIEIAKRAIRDEPYGG